MRALDGPGSGRATSSQRTVVLRRRFRARTPRQWGRSERQHAGRWCSEDLAGAGTGGGYYYHHRTSGLLKKFVATVSVYSLAGAVMRSSRAAKSGIWFCGDDRLIRCGAHSGGGNDAGERQVQMGAAGSDNVGWAVGSGWLGTRFNIDLPLLTTSVRPCAGAMACVAICGDKNSGGSGCGIGRGFEAVKVKTRQLRYSDARWPEGGGSRADAEVFLFGDVKEREEGKIPGLGLRLMGMGWRGSTCFRQLGLGGPWLSVWLRSSMGLELS